MVMLFGLARRTARKSRKHHYFTIDCIVHGALVAVGAHAAVEAVAVHGPAALFAREQVELRPLAGAEAGDDRESRQL